MSTPTHIYEVRDTTDEEQYQSLGMFLALDDAIRAIDMPAPPPHPGIDCTTERLEIHKREIGLDGESRCVWVASWREVYDEAEDEYKWERMKP